MSVRLDYSLMLAPLVEWGITDAVLDSALVQCDECVRGVLAQRAAGVLGFMDLPRNEELLAGSLTLARELEGVADDVVVLGIGGSALGTVALRSALLGNSINLKPIGAREHPRLHVLDNVDPRTLSDMLALVEPRRTLFIVISKSGGTTETMAQFILVSEHLKQVLGSAWREHLVIITDPVSGPLRQLAGNSIRSLPVPSNVGGRFSVLTPVSVFPAALAGIDVRSLLEGASSMLQRSQLRDGRENPAFMYAALQESAHRSRGLGTHVFMPYADGLREMADWFVQLWAESLGKLNAAGVPTGPTPIASLGATDQHSQVQLFMEGPVDKTVTFVALLQHDGDLPIPVSSDTPEAFRHLRSRTFGELIRVEQRATAAALALSGRPSMTLELDRLDAAHLGELIMLLQMATVYAGTMYGVNPLDQPGVELGKVLTAALLGREGYAAELDRLNSILAPDTRRVV